MGLITAVSSATQGGVSGVEIGTLPSIGVLEAASLVGTVSLLYLLAYLNLLEAANADRSTRRTIVAMAIPLLFAFAGVVIYHSLEALRWSVAP